MYEGGGSWCMRGGGSWCMRGGGSWWGRNGWCCRRLLCSGVCFRVRLVLLSFWFVEKSCCVVVVCVVFWL